MVLGLRITRFNRTQKNYMIFAGRLILATRQRREVAASRGGLPRFAVGGAHVAGSSAESQQLRIAHLPQTYAKVI